MKLIMLWSLFVRIKNCFRHFSLQGKVVFIVSMLISLSAFYDNNSFYIKVSSKKILQGDVVWLSASPQNDILSVNFTYKHNTIDFYRDEDSNSFIGFLAIDLEEPPGKKSLQITVKNKDGFEIIRNFDYYVIKNKFPIQRLWLPKSKVFLSKKNLKRHFREKAAIQRAFDSATHEKLWCDGFMSPSDGKITSPFGVKRFLNNKRRNPHSGVDFRASEGTPVPASSDGLVALTGNFFFAGKIVLIDHGMCIFTIYSHLSLISVKMGDKITKGEIIGLVGSTGRVTGPHLHWGVKINNQRIDPLSFLKIFEE